MTTEDLIKQYSSNLEEGLSSQEAQKRLAEHGPNCLEEKKTSMITRIILLFWGPIPWMIEIALVLSGYLRRWPDFYLILAMLIINASLEFWQEFKANNAIDALKQTLAPKATTLRDKTWQTIDAKTLVPGDIVSIKLGKVIPADVTLLSGEYLSVDQSALTGESLPVDKKVGDEVYSGSIAKLGEMIGIVTKTGMETFFGKTAKLVQSAVTVSHFQQAVLKIGRFLIYATLLIAAIIFCVSLFRIEVDKDLHESFGEILIFLLVLVIAGIPVAMPAVLSMSMAIGANRMAKLKAIVSKLVAIEELAGMNTLCSDKTGTLTKNILTLGDVETFDKTEADRVIFAAALASKFFEQDAIDQAICSSVKDPEELKKYVQEKFLPFDPVKKRTECTIKGPSDSFTVSKGAPQIILDLCHLEKDLADKVQEKILSLAEKGFRTLGVAQADSSGQNWQFLGLIPLFDPPRDDTKQTIEHVEKLGISVKMITGDHEAIAKEMAKKIGLSDNIISAKKAFSENKTPTIDLDKVDGIAQVYPEHKFEIVKAFQAKKHIVGMTGDGVNDAPALKQADVGIAVSGATDAARASADLILTEPGLYVIQEAIEEARRIFGRMTCYSIYRISETCRLLLFLFLAMLIFQTHPLSAIMIILIALLNDIPIMTVAYDNTKAQESPVVWDMREILDVAIGLSIVGVISTFGLYWIGQTYWGFSPEENKTLAFMAILCGGNLTIYLTRNKGMVWHRPFPNIKFFLATLFSQIVGTLISVYGFGTDDFLGIGWKYVGYSWIYILIWFGICALTKEAIYYYLKKHPKSMQKTSESLTK